MTESFGQMKIYVMPQRTNWDAGQHWLPCHLYRPEHCPGRQWGQPSVTGHCHSPFKLGTWICRKQNPGNLLGNSSDSGAIKAWGCPCCLSSLFISSPVAGVWTAVNLEDSPCPHPPAPSPEHHTDSVPWVSDFLRAGSVQARR